MALPRSARRLRKGLLAAGLLLAPVAASAHNVDVYQGPIISSGRITGLAGAYVAVAEGQDGEPFNVASLAQRDRALDRPWDWDFVFTIDVPTGVRIESQDFDNDGRRELGLAERDNVQLGVSLQLGRFGLGLLLRSLALSHALGTELLTLEAQDVALGAAYAFAGETVIVGAEVVVGGGALRLSEGPGSDVAQERAVSYGGVRLRPGVLWRPRASPWRFGAQFDPPQQAGASVIDPALAGRLQLPDGMAFPGTVRLGASRWFGPNAAHFNEPSPQALREREALGGEERALLERSAPAWEETARRPVLVTTELDVLSSVADAVGTGTFLLQEDSPDAPRSGARYSVSAHLGAEWEALPGWIITRGGSYLEPSRFSTSFRPHGTFGAEVKVPFWPSDLRVALAGDVAPRYRNIALSLGLWRSLGPLGSERTPPPPAPPAPAMP